MNTIPSLSPADLIAFEEDIAAEFNAAKIRAPIHLYFGNEEAIIRVFESVRPQDWVLCSWRSHYQCLLKGVPRDRLKAEIMAGRSISLCFPEYRIFSSAIVGGVVPIAVGIAMGIKRSGEAARVFCFMGEMTAETGIAHESVKYARSRAHPVTWALANNGNSVPGDAWPRLAPGNHSQDPTSRVGYLPLFPERSEMGPLSARNFERPGHQTLLLPETLRSAAAGGPKRSFQLKSSRVARRPEQRVVQFFRPRAKAHLRFLSNRLMLAQRALAPKMSPNFSCGGCRH